MGTVNTPNLLRDKLVFGLDVGHGSLKVMQVDEVSAEHHKSPRIIGYGTTTTVDGLPSSHFEHTIAITENGPIVLTALADGTVRL